MKKLFFFAAALFAAFTFSACSDSEDGPTINTSKLLGKWVALARYDYDAESDSYVEYDDKDHYIDLYILDFQDEKTVLVSFDKHLAASHGMTYTLKGSKITFREEDGYGYYYTITDLTDTQLELMKGDIDNNYKVIYERKTAE